MARSVARSRWWMGALLGLAVVAGSACKQPPPQEDPMKAVVTGYRKAVEPPLQAEEALAKVFVQIVQDAKGSPDPARAAQQIEAEVIPKAQAFLDEVSKITPTDATLAETHKFLVAAATLRLEGYKLVVQGFSQNNFDTFSQGQKKVTDSKIQEENYLARVDQSLRPYGQQLTLFAAPPVVTP